MSTRQVKRGERTYKAVALRTFLTANGIDLGLLQSVSFVASDGSRVTYESGNLDEESPLLAWEQDGSPPPQELGTVALLHREEIEVKHLERIVLDSGAEQ